MNRWKESEGSCRKLLMWYGYYASELRTCFVISKTSVGKKKLWGKEFKVNSCLFDWEKLLSSMSQTQLSLDSALSIKFCWEKKVSRNWGQPVLKNGEDLYWHANMRSGSFEGKSTSVNLLLFAMFSLHYACCRKGWRTLHKLAGLLSASVGNWLC